MRKFHSTQTKPLLLSIPVYLRGGFCFKLLHCQFPTPGSWEFFALRPWRTWIHSKIFFFLKGANYSFQNGGGGEGRILPLAKEHRSTLPSKGESQDGFINLSKVLGNLPMAFYKTPSVITALFCSASLSRLCDKILREFPQSAKK